MPFWFPRRVEVLETLVELRADITEFAPSGASVIHFVRTPEALRFVPRPRVVPRVFLVHGCSRDSFVSTCFYILHTRLMIITGVTAQCFVQTGSVAIIVSLKIAETNIHNNHRYSNNCYICYL